MTVPVSLRVLRVGSCRHMECIAARGGRMSPVDFPALCGLIRHPTSGWILYDTGYSDHLIDATEHWPERLYRVAVPVTLPPSEQISVQLERFGITPLDISVVIISHYHGDHVAGLKDFPNARFIALRADTEEIRSLQGHRWRATIGGNLPGLLPNDFTRRLVDADDCMSKSLPPSMTPFQEGLDLLGDGSLLGVPLPGHSKGQLGVYVPDADGRPAFLVADACWSLPACREGRLPSRITFFITADRRSYRETFLGLREISLREPAIALLPSHCLTAWGEYRDGA
jgi:glyoxylase-like metal-dependent hydrolase (beta-lactamase superfamily II)